MAYTTRMETPGQRIKKLRKLQKGLRAETVADAVGISRPHLSMIENDRDLPGRETLTAIASYFGISVDYLLHGGDATPEPPGAGEFVNDPDELALLAFWRSLNVNERALMLKMLGGQPPAV
nr:helix-turn-helix transcriptional regulator [uncultured Rhodopila sp.]